ncbi:MAG: TolC family protein, partial [Betaproteobacteria bacterium]
SILFYRELSQLVGRYVKEKVALDYQRLETEARLAKAEHTARSERNALQTQQDKLNNLLGRDVKTPFQVSTTEIAVGQPLEQSAAEASALAQRPDIQEAKLKLAQAQTGYKIKRSEYLPDLNLQMRYSRFLNVDFIPEQEWAVGLQLKWEFYDWGRKSHDLAGKTVGITQAKNDVRDTEAQVLIEVDSRLRELQEARELVKVTQLSVAAAREKLRVTMNLYRQKSALLKDVLQAQSDLTDANSEFQNALLSLWTAQAQLDKALGVG